MNKLNWGIIGLGAIAQKFSEAFVQTSNSKLLAIASNDNQKLENFKKNPRKDRYAYLLTPKGIREKSILTHKFIKRKRIEYKDLKNEIEALEKEAGLS